MSSPFKFHEGKLLNFHEGCPLGHGPWTKNADTVVKHGVNWMHLVLLGSSYWGWVVQAW